MNGEEVAGQDPWPRAERWVVLGLVLLGVALRAWRFPSVPPGLNQDEASAAYDAWSLLTYGVDRHGNRWPVHLVSWGSGQNVLYSWLSIPFLALLGRSAEAVRAVGLLAGCASLPAFYVAVRRLRDPGTALVALFLLAVNPWHVMASRWGLESNLFPPVFLLAFALLLWAPDRPALLAASAALFAACLYAYGTAYLVVPAFLALASAWLLWRASLPPRHWLAAAAVFVVLAAPIGLFLAVNVLGLPTLEVGGLTVPRLSGPPRFTTAAAISDGSLLSGLPSRALRAVRFLVVQDDPRISNTLPGIGALYAIGPPLAAVGLLFSLREAGRSRLRGRDALLLAWLAAALLLALSLAEVNTNRLNVVYFPLLILSAVGVVETCRWLRPRRPALAVAALVGVLALHAAFGVRFAAVYFGAFPAEIARVFCHGLPEAIRAVAEREPGTVCVTRAANMPYVHVLFQAGVDPRQFRQTVVYDDPGAEFQQVLSFDRWRFGLEGCPADAALVLSAREFAARKGGLGGRESRRFGGYVAVSSRR